MLHGAEPPIDFAALADATKDLMAYGKDLSTTRKWDELAKDEIAAAKEAGLSEREKEQGAQKQREYAAKLQQQRAETAEREAQEEEKRRAEAKAHLPGILGVQHVVDVGGLAGAYEYKHELTELSITVPNLPEGVRAKQLLVECGVTTLSVGLRGKPPYLKGTLKGKIVMDDVVWTVEGGCLRLELTKADPMNDKWDGCLEVPDEWQCNWQ